MTAMVDQEQYLISSILLNTRTYKSVKMNLLMARIAMTLTSAKVARKWQDIMFA